MVWQWGPHQRRAFKAMKDAYCRAPILIFPDLKLEYTIFTEASGTGAGGALLQDQGEGLRPIAFLSWKLKPTEQKYSAYECNWQPWRIAYKADDTMWKAVQAGWSF